MTQGYVSKLVSYVLAVSLLGAASIETAYAYIDPGTGSYLLQMLVAGVLGALFVIKVFWKNLKQTFVSLVIRRK